jgi:LysR family transcriptional regulator (chromosome initiation inhibitor)
VSSTMRLLSPQLQTFIATAKHGTVHAAASALCITQTGVTQRIKALEKQLATSLFVRSRRGMVLTKEGEALLRYCHSFQELEGEALFSITTTGTEKNVSIGITGPMTIMRTRIIPCCINVMRHYPRLLMRFDINDNDHRVRSLRRGETQLAIIDQHALSEEMEYKLLAPEQYVLVASPQWKKRKLKEIIKNEKIIDFDQQDQMTFEYLKKYRLFDLASKDRHFTNRTETLALMVSEEIGYGVLPLEFAKPYFASNQLVVLNGGVSLPHLLALAWYSRHQPPNYFSALIDACV